MFRPTFPNVKAAGVAKAAGLNHCAGSARVRPEDGLARVVGADRVLAQNRAGVGRVAKHRNRKREPGLSLIDGRYAASCESAPGRRESPPPAECHRLR